MDVNSGTIFLKQKEEDWQQMLAQGHLPQKKKNKQLSEIIAIAAFTSGLNLFILVGLSWILPKEIYILKAKIMVGRMEWTTILHTI